MAKHSSTKFTLVKHPPQDVSDEDFRREMLRYISLSDEEKWQDDLKKLGPAASFEYRAAKVEKWARGILGDEADQPLRYEYLDPEWEGAGEDSRWFAANALWAIEDARMWRDRGETDAAMARAFDAADSKVTFEMKPLADVGATNMENKRLADEARAKDADIVSRALARIFEHLVPEYPTYPKTAKLKSLRAVTRYIAESVIDLRDEKMRLQVTVRCRDYFSDIELLSGCFDDDGDIPNHAALSRSYYRRLDLAGYHPKKITN